MLSWLGVRKINETWYETIGDEKARNELILANYTNWSTSSSRSNHDCAILYDDGTWQAGGRLCVRRETLCTVCSITNTPVFTLKGSCMVGDIDWNYYLVLDDKNKLTHYDGGQQHSDSRVRRPGRHHKHLPTHAVHQRYGE